MRSSFWKRWLRGTSKANRTPSRRDERPRNERTILQVELLEDRVLPATFTPGDIAILDLANTTDNTTGSILEVNPSTGALVQTISIGSTGANALRFSDSGTSSFLSDSNDGSQLVLAAYNTADSTAADLATTGTNLTTGTDPDDRAVATFGNSGALTIQTHYVEPTSGDQTRSATTTNDSNYYITDKGGLFSNGTSSSSLSPTVNILNTRTFGGTVYISSTKTPLSTAASPTATTLTALPGLSTDADLQDFYLIQSGSNGATYDVLYTLDQNSGSAAINKFSLVGGTWVSNGSFTVAANATGMLAESNGAGNGATLYVLTTSQSADNSLIRLTDTTGWVNSATASSGFTLTNSTTLYTDIAGDTMKGIAFAPTTSALSISGLPASINATYRAPAIALAPSASFADTLTSSQLSTSTLTVAITANDDSANDVLGIMNEGSGFGQIGASGGTVTYNGTAIGTYPTTGAGDGSGGNSLVITFNANATAAAVSTLIDDISFQTDSSTFDTRTVQFTFTPSSGNGSAVSASESVVVQEAPLINAGSPITLGENYGAYSTTLTGINDNENDGNTNVTSVTASVTATSDPSLFATSPSIGNYSSSTGTATLSFTLAANQSGTATITVTVKNSLNLTSSVTYALTVNPILVTTSAISVAIGNTATLNSAELTAAEAGVPAANMVFTLTGNPPASDGTLEDNGVALVHGSTFSQADVNNGLVTYVSTGSTSAIDTITFSVSDSAGGSLSGQTFSVTVIAPAAFIPGDLAVLELGNSSDNTSGTIIELNPTTANQASPVESIPLSEMSFSDSGTSSFLSDTSDGTLLTFAAYNTTNYSGSDLSNDTATGARGVGTLNANGTFTLQTTYTEVGAGKETRSATSVDDTNWLITDKQGTYTNGDSGNWVDFNVLNTRSFGGVIYVSSTAPAAPEQISPAGDTSGAIPPAAVMTLASPTSIIAVGLPGLGTDTNGIDPNIQDFYLIQSGANGNAYDILYTLDATGVINKYSLINAGLPNATWVYNGSETIGGSPLSMVAENNGSGGASLFVTTSTTLEEFTDTTGYNKTINNSSVTNGSKTVTVASSTGLVVGETVTGTGFASGTTISTIVGTTLTLSNKCTGATGMETLTFGPVTLYTATGTNTLKGLAFAPIANTPPAAADLTVNLSAASRAYTSQPFTYTLTVANSGTVATAAGSVTVHFTLPSSNLTVSGFSAPGFTESQVGQVLTFSGGTLSGQSTATITVTVKDSVAETVTATPGAAVIGANNYSLSTVTTTFVPAVEVSDIPIAPVVNTSFTGAVASFSDGAATPGAFSVTINWGDGTTSAGTVSATTADEPINPEAVEPTQSYTLYVVNGTHTYTATGNFTVTVTVNDSAGDTGTVVSSATVGEPPLALTPVTIDTGATTAFSNLTVATFTDPGIAGAGASGPPSDYTSQFIASINWGDGTASSPGTITFNSATGVFSVEGSHTYATPGNYSIIVTLTPQTISVSLLDSSDPSTLTKAPSAEFIEQLNPFTANQTVPINILGLPTVATTSGNFALTASAASPSESRLHLSVNGEYLVLAGYNATAAETSDQSYLDPPSSVYRVIGTINGEGVINTTTALTDADYLDNFRGAISVNGTSFYTYGSSDNLYGLNEDPTGFVHYVAPGDFGGANSSTIITDQDNDNNGVEIFNNTLYDAIRSPKTGSDVSGIYVVGTPGTLPTTADTTSTLFIEVPQTNPFAVNDGDKTTSPYDFFMTDLSSNPDSINGVNVAYIADGVSGIARYDYDITGTETTAQWNFSYYITSTGTFAAADYTVDAGGQNDGQLAFAAPYSATNLPPLGGTGYAGGVTGLTGEVVNGQVELFAVTSGVGYGSIKNSVPGNSVIEVTDTGMNSTYTVLATAGSNAEYRGVALSPWAAVTSTAQVTLGTLTTLQTSPVPGGAAMFTATVTANPAVATPVGTVTFEIDGVAQATVTLVNGKASFTSTALTPGTHTITAVYNGSAGFLSSTASLTQGTSTLVTTPLVVEYYATGADAGGAPQVNVYNSQTNALVASFYAFNPGFLGGVTVAVGDVNGDGTPDIICAAGPGGGPQVVVIDGTKLSQVQSNGEIASSAILTSFDAFSSSFNGGVYVAAGEVIGDGHADIICGAGEGGGPQVTVWSGKNFTLLDSFYAMPSGFKGGVRVAAGDVNGDGFADIITGAGPGGLAQVTIFNGQGLSILESFYAFANFGGGVYVASGGNGNIIVGAGPGADSRISAFNGLTGAQLFTLTDPRFTGVSDVTNEGDSTGVRVGSTTVNGQVEILATPGPGSPALLDIFSAQNQGLLAEFFAYAPGFEGGAFVGG